MSSNIWNISKKEAEEPFALISHTLSVSETFAINRHFISTYQQTIKQWERETFFEGLKRVCKLFEINAQQDS